MSFSAKNLSLITRKRRPPSPPPSTAVSPSTTSSRLVKAPEAGGYSPNTPARSATPGSSAANLSPTSSDVPLITPVAKRKLAAARRTSNPSNATPSPSASTTVSSSTEAQSSSPTAGPQEYPPWDRSVEVSWTRKPANEEDEQADGLAFGEIAARIALGQSRTAAPRHDMIPDTNHNCRYFQLPSHIRFAVMKHLLNDDDDGTAGHSKPIRLNAPYHLRPVWPDATAAFDTLGAVLAPLERYAAASRAMRADVLAALLLTRRFHAVLSPFVRERLHPGVAFFLRRRAPLAASVTLEVDLSRLGGQAHPAAARGLDGARVGLGQVRRLLEEFVQGQVRSRPRCAAGAGEAAAAAVGLRDLRVLVRRYYGVRPGVVPRAQYVSPENLAWVLSPLKRLGEAVVDGVTIVGAGKELTAELILSIWGAGAPVGVVDLDRLALLTGHVSCRMPAREYPATPGQSSVVDYGANGPDGQGRDRGGLWLVRHGQDGSYHPCRRLDGPDALEIGSGSPASAGMPQSRKLRVVRVVKRTNKTDATPKRLFSQFLFQARTKRKGSDGSSLGRAGRKMFRKLDLDRILSGGAKGLFGHN